MDRWLHHLLRSPLRFVRRHVCDGSHPCTDTGTAFVRDGGLVLTVPRAVCRNVQVRREPHSGSARKNEADDIAPIKRAIISQRAKTKLMMTPKSATLSMPFEPMSVVFKNLHYRCGVSEIVLGDANSHRMPPVCKSKSTAPQMTGSCWLVSAAVQRPGMCSLGSLQ